MPRVLPLLLLVGCGSGAGAGDADGADDLEPDAPPFTERDPLQQPFASDSIWNMPLGSDAVYVPANLKAIPSGEWSWGLPFPDVDQIVLTPDAPLVEVRYSSVGWDGGDRCVPTSAEVLATIPMPADFLVPNATSNNSAAFLAADGRTLIQTQPLARCDAGGVATSLVRAPDGDLYGDGIVGAHGGSGLSSVGGALRVGELRPGGPPPRHALKITLYMKEAFRCETSDECFRWPAQRGDSYAVGFYGTGPDNPNEGNAAMVMGALLALPPDVDLDGLGLETEPARQLAWTFQNYGGYVVDDAYGEAFLLGTENGPRGSWIDQFEADWGYAFHQSSDSGTAWTRDLQRLLPELMIVDNNGPGAIGGGGTPRQPLAPPIE